MRILTLFTAGFVFASGCGHKPAQEPGPGAGEGRKPATAETAEGGRLKSIVTDFKESGSYVMYWTESGRIYRGGCLPGGPLLKSNCMENLRNVGFSAFESSLGKKVNHEIDQLKAEIQAAGAKIQKIEGKIAASNDALADAVAAEALNAQEKKKVADQIGSVENFLQEFKVQLHLINAKVAAIPADQDLTEMGAEIAGELTEYRDKLHSLYHKANEISGRLQSLAAAIDSLSREIAACTSHFQELTGVMGSLKPRLEQAIVDAGDFSLTMEYLNDEVIYRVTVGKDWFATTRPVVRLFDPVFNALD